MQFRSGTASESREDSKEEFKEAESPNKYILRAGDFDSEICKIMLFYFVNCLYVIKYNNKLQMHLNSIRQ